MVQSPEPTKESEFGKGLIICLVKFAEHRYRWLEIRKKYTAYFSESDAIRMHFNAASDHLYEIEVPEEWKDTDIGKKVEKLQSLGLKIGHGFGKETWTEADVDKAYSLCQEIALLIDKKIGLSPEVGRW